MPGIIHRAGCCCFTEADTPCGECSGLTPAKWTVVISGATACADPTCYWHGSLYAIGKDWSPSVNGTFILHHSPDLSPPGSACSWHDSPWNSTFSFTHETYGNDSSCADPPDGSWPQNRGISLLIRDVGGNPTARLTISGWGFLSMVWSDTTITDCETEFVLPGSQTCGGAGPPPYAGGSATCTPGGSPFCETIHCTTHQHCATCRDLEGGRKWRESLRKGFTLPDDETDFPCPHGVPWNPTPEQLPGPAIANWSGRPLPARSSFADRVRGLCLICRAVDRAGDCYFGNQTSCSQRRIISDGGTAWQTALSECGGLLRAAVDVYYKSLTIGRTTRPTLDKEQES